ncbi:MAG: hypothetical protein QM767_16690 [Anaeromyxobacter sp.]
MDPALPPAAAPLTTSADPLTAGEELMVVRAGAWRLLVPLRHVQRVHPAALPAARPATAPVAPLIGVRGALLPVAFAAALAGEREVTLSPHHQLVELGARGLRGLLWVDAAEDLVAHAPLGEDQPSPDLVAGWSGTDRPLAVLDVPALLRSLAALPD